jgi:hypothetical protein
MKALIKNPEESPKTLILEGEFGTGKTTLARIFARELNGVKELDYDINSSPFYFEFDSTVIGNVEEIKKLKDLFGGGFGDFWKVVVFDESHAVSQQAQNALLKILEEVKTKTFFVFCTTHVHKVIPTIRSRSLEMNFSTVSYDDIIEHLGTIEPILQITVPANIKDVIARRSRGHLRNVHMLLDKFLIVGEEVFHMSTLSSVDLFCDYFIAIKSDNETDVMKYINLLNEIPIESLRMDFSEFVSKCMQGFVGLPCNNAKIEGMIKLYGTDFLKITKNFFNNWTRYIFDSEYHFECGMLYFFQLLRIDMNMVVKKETPMVSGVMKAR